MSTNNNFVNCFVKLANASLTEKHKIYVLLNHNINIFFVRKWYPINRYKIYVLFNCDCYKPGNEYRNFLHKYNIISC